MFARHVVNCVVRANLCFLNTKRGCEMNPRTSPTAAVRHAMNVSRNVAITTGLSAVEKQTLNTKMESTSTRWVVPWTAPHISAHLPLLISIDPILGQCLWERQHQPQTHTYKLLCLLHTHTLSLSLVILLASVPSGQESDLIRNHGNWPGQSADDWPEGKGARWTDLQSRRRSARSYSFPFEGVYSTFNHLLNVCYLQSECVQWPLGSGAAVSTPLTF